MIVILLWKQWEIGYLWGLGAKSWKPAAPSESEQRLGGEGLPQWLTLPALAGLEGSLGLLMFVTRPFGQRLDFWRCWSSLACCFCIILSSVSCGFCVGWRYSLLWCMTIHHLLFNFSSKLSLYFFCCARRILICFNNIKVFNRMFALVTKTD